MSFQIIIIIYVMLMTLGTYSFFKYREDQLIWSYFRKYVFILFLPIFDIFSTITFVNKYGIEAEANIIGRYLLHSLGNYAYPFMYIFSAIGLISTFFISYLVCKKLYPIEREIKNHFKMKMLSEEDFIRINMNSLIFFLFVGYIIVIINNTIIL